MSSAGHLLAVRFPTRLILVHWRWRRYVPLKRPLAFSRLDCIVSRTIVFFFFLAFVVVIAKEREQPTASSRDWTTSVNVSGCSTPGAATFYCSSLGLSSICLALLNAIWESTWLSYRRESHRNNDAAVNWHGRGDCIDRICRSCCAASEAELDTTSCRCRKFIYLHHQTLRTIMEQHC
jgi:hypothetical protein